MSEDGTLFLSRAAGFLSLDGAIRPSVRGKVCAAAVPAVRREARANRKVSEGDVAARNDRRRKQAISSERNFSGKSGQRTKGGEEQNLQRSVLPRGEYDIELDEAGFNDDKADEGEDGEDLTTEEEENHEETAISRRNKSKGFYSDSLRSYLSEIRRFDMLKHSEEVDLARKIRIAVKAERAKERLVKKLKRAPKFVEWAKEVDMSVPELQKAIVEGTAAKQKLVTANLRLVNSIVNKLVRRASARIGGPEIQDLMQEGVFGLLRAAEKFDGEKGYKFSTYATYWITSFVSRGMYIIDRPVKVPSQVHELYNRARKVHREFFQKNGVPPSEDQLAELAGVTVAKLRFCLECMKQATVSTDVNISDDKDSPITLGDLLESEEDLAEHLVDSMFKADLDKTLRKHLNPKERTALRLRFGLDDGAERTLKQIANVLGISSERTRQVIFNALVKLRKPEVRSEMADYLPVIASAATSSQDKPKKEDTR